MKLPKIHAGHIFNHTWYLVRVVQQRVLEFDPLCNEGKIETARLSMIAETWEDLAVVGWCLLDESVNHYIECQILELPTIWNTLEPGLSICICWEGFCTILDLENYSRIMYLSLVNANLFYANFTNTNFQKIPIPHYETEIPSLAHILLYILLTDST